jgi:hypothetical protein
MTPISICLRIRLMVLVALTFLMFSCGCMVTKERDISTLRHEVECAAILQKLRNQYEACTNGKQRLHFCMSLVDANIIGETKPVDRLYAIFGADAVELSADSDGFGRIQVSFADYLQIYPTAARSWDGWYLAVSYSRESRTITRYFLSDIWKSVFMQKWGWCGSPNANQRAVSRSLDAREELYRSLDIVAPKCDLERTGSKKED